MIRSACALPSAVRQRVLAYGCSDAVINLGDPLRLTTIAGAEMRPGSGFAMHPAHAPLTICFEGEVETVCVRFRYASAGVIGDGMARDSAILHGELLDELVRRCRQRRGMPTLARLRFLEELLSRSLAGRGLDRSTQMIRTVFAALERDRDRASLGELAFGAGVSERHLERMFKSHAGLSPTAFRRRLRFRSIIQRLKRMRYPTLCEAALDGGYYDQAHFTREFREFSGLPPAEYLAELGRADTVNFNLDPRAVMLLR